MSEIESYKYENFTVEIHQDEQPDSPREWDNVGTMVCFHPRYTLGDTNHGYGDGPGLLEFLETEKPPVVLALYLLDHSGLCMSTGEFGCDPGGWDTSNVGVIYATAETIKKEYGAVTHKTIKQARHCLEAEVETYSQFLQGDVYGYTIEDPDGKPVESCWGYYGMDDVRAEAKSMAEGCAAEARKEKQAKLKAQIKHRAPLARRGA